MGGRRGLLIAGRAIRREKYSQATDDNPPRLLSPHTSHDDVVADELLPADSPRQTHMRPAMLALDKVLQIADGADAEGHRDNLHDRQAHTPEVGAGRPTCVACRRTPRDCVS